LLCAAFLKITEVAQIYGPLFTTVKTKYYFDQKMGWAKFWKISFQTLLVTLGMVSNFSAENHFGQFLKNCAKKRTFRLKNSLKN
jgi:hypothetical protein